jgi:hypothetical protein
MTDRIEDESSRFLECLSYSVGLTHIDIGAGRVSHSNLLTCLANPAQLAIVETARIRHAVLRAGIKDGEFDGGRATIDDEYVHELFLYR